MKVLVTGASGRVARLGIAGLAGRHRLRLTDLGDQPKLPANAEYISCDLSACDDATLSALFADVETVIHSAYAHSSSEKDVYSPNPPQIDRFEVELENIRVAQRIYRQAFDAGVRRIVMVSSNHAADWYEHARIHERKRDMIAPGDLPLSDNFYGWAKAAYELLGFPYACGTFGRALEVVSLRIGSPYPIDPSRYRPESGTPEMSLKKPNGAAGFKRALGAFLSDRDCAELFRAAVEAPEINGEQGVPWLVAYGISDNTRAYWSLRSAREGLGYAPCDDSELLYSDAIRELLVGTGAAGRLG